MWVHFGREIVFLRNFMGAINEAQQHPTVIYEDNAAAELLAKQ
jgi:hypothetical protein